MMLKLFSVLSLLCLLFSCSEQRKEDESSVKSKKKTRHNSQPIKQFCYRNEYPFPDEPESKDVEELIIFIIDDITAEGSFDWLPMYKDSRTGTFRGSIHDNIIDAKYIFMQEGIEDTVMIKIYFDSTQATIKGIDAPKELGLDITLKKVNCE